MVALLIALDISKAFNNGAATQTHTNSPLMASVYAIIKSKKVVVNGQPSEAYEINTSIPTKLSP